MSSRFNLVYRCGFIEPATDEQYEAFLVNEVSKKKMPISVNNQLYFLVSNECIDCINKKFMKDKNHNLELYKYLDNK